MLALPHKCVVELRSWLQCNSEESRAHVKLGEELGTPNSVEQSFRHGHAIMISDSGCIDLPEVNAKPFV